MIARTEARPQAFGEYSDTSSVARWLRYALMATCLASVVVAGLSAVYLSKLEDESDATYLLSREVADANDAVGYASIFEVLLYLACVVLFLVWTYRSYRNLRALGAEEVRFGKGWAIGGWFVPILGWWRPKQIVNDIWRASDADLPATALRREWQDRAPPILLAAWWTVWLASIVVDRISVRFDDVPIDDARTGASLFILTLALTAVGAILAARVVATLTARQEERAARIERLPPPAPAFSAAPERPL